MGADDANLTNLGDLADPTRHQGLLDISGCSAEELQAYLQQLLLIRRAEQHLAAMRKSGSIGGPVHLGVGQEAIAVGVSRSLRKSDYVFGAHRSHAHLLALGSSLRGLFAEVLGKATGLSRGMGGSMHLWDQPNGFYGSTPIVAGTVPLAVGAAIAAKLKATDAVAVAYFGDGAAEEGVLHESLNLARIQRAPVLFVAENNFYSSHLEIAQRQPSNSTARFAHAHHIDAEIVDGNDVVAVSRSAARLIAKCRAGAGPCFLEAVTFRWLGHVDWRDDIDVGVSRSHQQLLQWRARDPITRLAGAMERAAMWNGDSMAKLEAQIDSAVQNAWNQATSDPWPDDAIVLGAVYAALPDRP